MSWFRRGNSSKPPPFAPFVGAYGKLPRFGDFLSVRAGAEPAMAFQAWLARAVDWAERRQLPGWPTLFEDAPQAFVFRPRPSAGGLLVGAVRASRDSVGRRFPFAMFSAIAEETVAFAPHLLPIAMAGFVERAEVLMRQIDVVSTPQEVESWIDTLPPIVVDEGAARAYATWCERTLVTDLWADVYGERDGVGAKYAVQMLREATAPFYGTEDLQTQLGARLPLGQAGAYQAAFWIELARRLAGGRAHVPSFLYALASPKSILLALGDAHPSMLGEGAAGVGDTDEICDLTSATPDWSPNLRPLDPALEREVASGESALSVLLRTVGGDGAQGEGNGRRGRISLT